jgi:hypothetical protein
VCRDPSENLRVRKPFGNHRRELRYKYYLRDPSSKLNKNFYLQSLCHTKTASYYSAINTADGLAMSYFRKQIQLQQYSKHVGALHLFTAFLFTSPMRFVKQTLYMSVPMFIQAHRNRAELHTARQSDPPHRFFIRGGALLYVPRHFNAHRSFYYFRH